MLALSLGETAWKSLPKALRNKRDKKQTRPHVYNRTVPVWEKLHIIGVKRFNTYIKRYSAVYAGFKADMPEHMHKQLLVDYQVNRKLPVKLLNTVYYIPEKVRETIYEREQGLCMRCKKEVVNEHVGVMSPERISTFHHLAVYHKLTHPGPSTEPNCGLLCRYCWGNEWSGIKYKQILHKKMTVDEFRAWLETKEARFQAKRYDKRPKKSE